MGDPVIDLSVESVERHFIALSRFGNLGPGLDDGFSRPSWSYEESQAIEYIRQAGIAEGMLAAYDEVGNLYLSTPVTAQRVIQIGSHLDTVPFGGQFDGGAGIVAGLEAILALKERWAEIDCILQLVVWRGEESATFGAVCKGSQAAFGLNDPAILDKKFQQKTLEEAILSQGFDADYIRQQRPTLSQQQIDSIAVHFELHIEQSSLLQA
ncbi:MAG: M28 family peptidase, partial [Anaerolineales bacterium]